MVRYGGWSVPGCISPSVVLLRRRFERRYRINTPNIVRAFYNIDRPGKVH